MIREPKRLRQSEQGALRAGLEAAHAGLPNRERLDALAERLRAAGVALPLDVGEQSLNSVTRNRALVEPSRWSVLVRVGLASLIVGVGVLPWLLQSKQRATPVTLVASAPALSAAPAPLANVVSEPPRIDTPTTGSLRAKQDRQDKQESQPKPVASSAPTASSLAEPRTALVAAKRTPPADSTSRAPVNRPTPTSTPTQRVPADTSDELPASATPETELTLLKQARNALNGDPLSAYALSERCAREFPRGAFTQEREFIAISALHRLGRASEAERRADGFRSRYPRSAYLPQLERMFGGGTAP